jgi:transcriptional regulator with XRE-family HTH domain
VEREKILGVRRDLGRRLSEIRMARGMTQAQVAVEMGVDVKYIKDFEGGRQPNPTLQTIMSFAHAVDARVGELFVPPTTRKRRKAGRPKKVVAGS